MSFLDVQRIKITYGGCCGCGFITTYAISAYMYHHWRCEFKSRRSDEVYSIQHYMIKVCQWLVTGLLLPPDSSTNKTDHHDITKILLKVALNTINLNQPSKSYVCFSYVLLTVMSIIETQNILLIDEHSPLTSNHQT